MSNVIQIEEMRLTRAQRTYAPTECKHMNLTMDDEGDVVSCDDCKKQVSAFWALQMLSRHYQQSLEKLANQARRQAEVEKKILHLKAAQLVESAWRSRTHVPVCPHCREAIFPGDGFGRNEINKEIAERRRAEKAKNHG